MKLKLMARQIYYKVGMIEIDMPNLLDDEGIHSEIQNWLYANEDLWIDKLAYDLDLSHYEHGFGMNDLTDWSDRTEETENRYELPNGEGGHI